MDSAHPDALRELRGLLAGGRFREVLDRHRAEGAGVALPEADLAVATAATRLGELDQATGLAQEALGQFRSRADEDGRMRTLNLLGAIAFERGELELASQRFAESLTLARGLGDRLMTGRALNNLASVVHLRGDGEAALSYYREALLVYQQLGDRRGAAETYHNLGLVLRESGATDEAGRASEHAVRHASLVGDPGLLGLVITGRAEVALATGDLAVAEEAVDRADGLAAEADDAVGWAEVRRVRALVALGRGDAGRALEQALMARERAEALGSTLVQAESAAVAAEALKRLRRPAEAERLLVEARLLFSGLGAMAHLQRLDQPN
jgi:tetratricopeptide (TPR) repeat protein